MSVQSNVILSGHWFSVESLWHIVSTKQELQDDMSSGAAVRACMMIWISTKKGKYMNYVDVLWQHLVIVASPQSCLANARRWWLVHLCVWPYPVSCDIDLAWKVLSMLHTVVSCAVQQQSCRKACSRLYWYVISLLQDQNLDKTGHAWAKSWQCLPHLTSLCSICTLMHSAAFATC